MEESFHGAVLSRGRASRGCCSVGGALERTCGRPAVDFPLDNTSYSG
jgi:hypothetical protein